MNSRRRKISELWEREIPALNALTEQGAVEEKWNIGELKKKIYSSHIEQTKWNKKSN